ncbi:MAG: thymidine phosphorylase, partial [Pseudomonadota bacterium]
AAGCKSRAVVTDMNQPVAPAIGNAVEVTEALKVLTDPKPEQRLCQLTIALTGELLELAGVSSSAEEGGRSALSVLTSGKAAEKFVAMVAELGGPMDVLDGGPMAHLPVAPVIQPVFPCEGGVVEAIDGQILGNLVVQLGGGRTTPQDEIDPRVGLSQVAGLGETVDEHRPFAFVHAAKLSDVEAAAPAVQAAFQLGSNAAIPPLIHGRLDG